MSFNFTFWFCLIILFSFARFLYCIIILLFFLLQVDKIFGIWYRRVHALLTLLDRIIFFEYWCSLILLFLWVYHLCYKNDIDKTFDISCLFHLRKVDLNRNDQMTFYRNYVYTFLFYLSVCWSNSLIPNPLFLVRAYLFKVYWKSGIFLIVSVVIVRC